MICEDDLLKRYSEIKDIHMDNSGSPNATLLLASYRDMCKNRRTAGDVQSRRTTTDLGVFLESVQVTT